VRCHSERALLGLRGAAPGEIGDRDEQAGLAMALHHVWMTTVAALVFAAITAGVVAFQLALALGAPWGEYAMGGRAPGRFPSAMRVAAVGQAVLLAVIAVVVLSDARLVSPSFAEAFPWLIWFVVVFSAVSVVLNTLTPSARERRIWAPVTLVMLACSLIVAVAAP
jgi:hypothetical protein